MHTFQIYSRNLLAGFLDAIDLKFFLKNETQPDSSQKLCAPRAVMYRVHNNTVYLKFKLKI